MSNYRQVQTFTVDKFSLEVHPYIAVPANVFEAGAAVQYGADFKVAFKRAEPQQNKIGLVQLIFPQTKVFDRTTAGSWNVDKRNPDQEESRPAVKCLYSDKNSKIGAHSEFYQGQDTRGFSPTECWLLDTPREFNAAFRQGVFSGNTHTKFANYVVDLSSGKLFDNGLFWGYSVVQDSAQLTTFDLQIVTPKSCLLSRTNEHLDAIMAFLEEKSRDDVKKLIA